jgi:propanediol utilization protein
MKNKTFRVQIEVSGHHCHISRADLDQIYGQGYTLKPIKTLSQTGQFASQETINIKVGNKLLKNLRILGPERKNTQVEISLSEAYHLKISPPITECTQPQKKKNGCIICEIIGPKGKIKRRAIIVAFRHFHTDPKTAKKLKLKNGQLVSVKTKGQRGLIFNNVLVRVDPSFNSRINLDTDEANASGLKSGDFGDLIY